MKTKIRVCLVILIIATGYVVVSLSDQFLVTGEGPVLKAELEAKHEVVGSGEVRDIDTLPEIDFPLLDQARSLDLIEMELDFPESLKELEGSRVSLVGFMAPFDNLQDMRRCMIVPSYVGCTFCSPPSLTQVVYVNQGAGGESMRHFPFIEEPSFVTGTLRLSLPESDHEGALQGFIYFIEDAVITPYTGNAPKRAAGHQASSEGQAVHQPGAMLPSLEKTELLSQVADLIGKEPIRPVEIEIVSSMEFGDLVRNKLEKTYPEESRAARIRAFSMLGMVPEDCDWIDNLAGTYLARRSAMSDDAGERIYLLNSVDQNHPYVRLDLVGAMTDAIFRQHFPHQSADGLEIDSSAVNDDARRADEALRAGIRGMAVYRYSRARGISPAAPLPTALFQRAEAREFLSVGFELWQTLPGDVGPFFVDYLVGATGPFTGIDEALASPPVTTIELFRPRWHETPELWQPNPVREDFADNLIETPPTLTSVLGVGGLIPWLAQWYPVDVCKSLVGQWAGDRWALWLFPDGDSALMLETRWQDEDSAAKFREAVPEDPRQVILPYDPANHTIRVIRGTSENALSSVSSVFQGTE